MEAMFQLWRNYARSIHPLLSPTRCNSIYTLASNVFLSKRIKDVKGVNELEVVQNRYIRSDISLGVSDIASLLRSYNNPSYLSQGKLIHEQIIRIGLQQDRFLGNLLVQMYSKCGSIEKARAVFDSMSDRNVFSWNIMVGAYGSLGQLDEALDLFLQMPQRNKVSWSLMMKAYAKKGLLEESLQFFQQMPDKDEVAWTTAISVYIQNGQLNQGMKLFQQMGQRDEVSWNMMIAACAEHGLLHKALDLFIKMPRRNLISWNTMIVAFLHHGEAEAAFQLFQLMPQRNVVSWTTMVSGYAKQGWLKDALSLFCQMPCRNVVSWTALIEGYCKQGQLKDALSLFEDMPQRDVVSWNAILSAFAQQGQVKEALHHFYQIPKRNVVSWNIMIGAYTLQGQVDDAFHLFQQMQDKGVNFDKVTIVNLLTACTLSQGQYVHSLLKRSLLKSDVAVQSALIHMYSRWGSLGSARAVFENFAHLDVIFWTSMITAYSQHGHVKDALQKFREMHLSGMAADDATFSSVIFACSLSGLKDDGCHIFVSMGCDDCIFPKLEHYNCIVNLLGKAGELDEACALLNMMVYIPEATSLLGSCAV